MDIARARQLSLCFIMALCFILALPSFAQDTDVYRLISAMLGDTPLATDLQSLTDEIGGRATGSPANLKSVDWVL